MLKTHVFTARVSNTTLDYTYMTFVLFELFIVFNYYVNDHYILHVSILYFTFNSLLTNEINTLFTINTGNSNQHYKSSPYRIKCTVISDSVSDWLLNRWPRCQSNNYLRSVGHFSSIHIKISTLISNPRIYFLGHEVSRGGANVPLCPALSHFVPLQKMSRSEKQVRNGTKAGHFTF